MELKSLQEIKGLLTLSYLQCSHRGILYSAAWYEQTTWLSVLLGVCIYFFNLLSSSFPPSLPYSPLPLFLCLFPPFLCVTFLLPPYNYFYHFLLLLRAAELAQCIEVPLETVPQLEHSTAYYTEFNTYSYGKALYDLREYRRAAHALKGAQSIEGIFLKLYSLYLVSNSFNNSNCTSNEMGGFFNE